MPEVSVDKGRVIQVSNLLNSQSSEIVAHLSGLLTAVNALLADPEGGLWLQRASPVMSASFGEFARMLTDAIRNIPEFAHSFEQVADQLNQMDNQLASSSSSNK